MTFECDFELPSQAEPGHAYDRTIFIPFTSFNATYRGRLKEDAKPINLKKIKRVSIMMRRYVDIPVEMLVRVLKSASFFGTQEGDFSLSLRSICALSEVPSVDAEATVIDHSALEKGNSKVESSLSGEGPVSH